jgi:hypothetical protein
LSGKSLDDSVPTFLESFDPFPQLLILSFTSPILLDFLLSTSIAHSSIDRDREGETHTSPKLAVLFLEFSDTALEITKLGLAFVTRVLSGDTVTVRTGLLAFFRRDVSAGALARRTGGWSGFCNRR